MKCLLKSKFFQIGIYLFWVASSALAAPLKEFKSTIQSCGTYEIAGTLHMDPDRIVVYVVHEKTRSEFRLYPEASEAAKFTAYLDIPTVMTASVVKLNGSVGTLRSPASFKVRVPDPLYPQNNGGFRMIKKWKCQK